MKRLTHRGGMALVITLVIAAVLPSYIRAYTVAGEMILFRDQAGHLAVKRVVAGPGVRLAMRDNHLMIDDRPLGYLAVSDQERSRISRGTLGTILEREHGNGPQVHVSYTPGIGALASFELLKVPGNMFFVLGSNRDISIDSRLYGPIPRDRILGRVVGHTWSAD